MTTTTPPARQPAVRPQPSGAAAATGVGGTVVLVATRSLLWLGVQLLVAGLLVLGGTTAAGHPLNAAAAWWMVDGALIDLGTLGLIGWLLRRDGRSYRSLLGPPAAAWQVALGALGVLAATVPAMVLGAEVNKAFYGDATPPMLAVVDVPLLASAFSVVVVPLLAGLAEPVAYLGVVLPRLERRIGQPWVATTIVVAVWAVEHAWAAAPSAARGLDPAGGDRAGEVSGPGGALAGGVSNHVGPERRGVARRAYRANGSAAQGTAGGVQRGGVVVRPSPLTLRLKKFARSGDMIICRRLLHATPRLSAPSHPRMGAAC